MSAPFGLKLYQRQSLDALRDYLAEAAATGDANLAFYNHTHRPYQDAPALPGLPYICLRVPTGGGKTILAAHSIGIGCDAFLKSETPCVLWLVPSQTIRDQTLATLQIRAHPNRRALAERFGENVRVMTVTEALYAKRADYDGGACVIVATLQTFRREDKDGLKVYAPNGELMDHFSGLPDRLRHGLEKGPAGEPVPSLANVLRLRRPMVIVDEAHNARTALSFDVLARLAPALIVEFTATPVTPDTVDAAKSVIPSNVLHQVSAAELKAAEMIKLPLVLRGRRDPNDTIVDAIGWLDELAGIAAQEEAETGEFIRPVMLLQAERKSKTEKTLHAEEVKKLLIDSFRQPEEHIAIATGESNELDGVNLFARDCPVRFIITQSKLREGWDCSFAYVLCSVAEQKSATAVEQLLGRVLRLPSASRKKREKLNHSYAFATTTSFQAAANTLKDGLVNNGFERIEAEALVRADADSFQGFEEGGVAFVHEDALPQESRFRGGEGDPGTGDRRARPNRCGNRPDHGARRPNLHRPHHVHHGGGIRRRTRERARLDGSVRPQDTRRASRAATFRRRRSVLQYSLPCGNAQRQAGTVRPRSFPRYSMGAGDLRPGAYPRLFRAALEARGSSAPGRDRARQGENLLR